MGERLMNNNVFLAAGKLWRHLIT